ATALFQKKLRGQRQEISRPQKRRKQVGQVLHSSNQNRPKLPKSTPTLALISETMSNCTALYLAPVIHTLFSKPLLTPRIVIRPPFSLHKTVGAISRQAEADALAASC